MKPLLILTCCLILTCTAALGEDLPRDATPPASDHTLCPAIWSDLTALRVSPMHLEIKELLESLRGREAALLADLAAAEDETRSQRIISAIEDLDLERDLAILRIQARYARQAERWTLARQIQERIAELEQQQVVAVR